MRRGAYRVRPPVTPNQAQFEGTVNLAGESSPVGSAVRQYVVEQSRA